jgi:3-hydroxyisobutyrate dehydrogenase-like beta-hydroxyacid dehydrogenase
MTTVGLLHPGEMGTTLAEALLKRRHEVLWASSGRSDSTRGRAEAAGLTDVGSAEALAERSHVILSVCPPHAAREVARSSRGGAGLFVDANAIAPATARAIAAEHGSSNFVDGGIIGPPPRNSGTTRLYLSGPRAATVSELFEGTPVEVRIVANRVGEASAVKLAYAAWTKGTAALLLAIRSVAEAEGVEEPLLAEWRLSLPALPEELVRAARSADAKGWRWVGEMEEIAAMFAAAGLPDGFHRAAAETFGSAVHLKRADHPAG